MALITGASRGIGKAIAIELANMGADVLINYNSSESLAKEVMEECQNIGVRSQIYKADTSVSSDVDEMFEKADVTDQKYDKVRRDNIMVKSGSGFTVKAGGF
mgnify:CR=1 FL=1